MSAALLREAAKIMRDAWGPAAKQAAIDAAKPRATNHHIGTMPATMIAVADWLGGCAERRNATSDARIEHDDAEKAWYEPALAVARAYLGDGS